VYGTLRRLEGEGLLTSRLVASSEGPARRYYALTSAGAATLERWVSAWRDVAGAIERLVADDREGA